ncbi:MAG: hypothetical protein ACI9UQ_001799, partial [Candidatus Krumholzibacteriia bacterium]
SSLVAMIWADAGAAAITAKTTESNNTNLWADKQVSVFLFEFILDIVRLPSS